MQYFKIFAKVRTKHMVKCSDDKPPTKIMGKHIRLMKRHGPAGAIERAIKMVNSDTVKRWAAWCACRARLYGSVQQLDNMNPIEISLAASGARALHGEDLTESLSLGRLEYAEQLEHLARLVDNS